MFSHLQNIAKKYSEFINFPIYLWTSHEEEKEVPVEVEETETETEASVEVEDEEEETEPGKFIAVYDDVRCSSNLQPLKPKPLRRPCGTGSC